MISNEQRAHDLAIYMLDGVKQNMVNEAIQNGTTKVDFVILKEYMELYLNNLETFNQIFPSND
ncbi:hypothetical protein NXZ77_22495 [Lysinibacillus boronitolerans]|uniref:hypothetical protein n=1 Tax=Lysinibacillus boronitolerans TaxID=309788 RepID=UPI0021624E6D|nr:hypothetical protein [Lysinibacillus boronitolerans]MCS1394336.1 hypothetical protein [Lysinibacillus boronitolerans]